jgi:hypothetical protein
MPVVGMRGGTAFRFFLVRLLAALLFTGAAGLAFAAEDSWQAHVGQALGKAGAKMPGGAELIRDGGMAVPSAMGSAIAINFQPTGGGKAAITGDFVLIAKEVNPVLKALRDHGIEVTAIHNHMLEDEPHLYFMHFWANDHAKKLAEGLKAALAQINVAKS